MRRAFDAFEQLIKVHPQSIYAHDARHTHDFPAQPPRGLRGLTSRDLYLKREAYVASIDRARYCIENYDGAPATKEALQIMDRLL